MSPTTVTCSTGGPGTSGFQSTPLHITWTSTGGKEAWIGVDTSDAQAAPYAGPLAPGSGSFDDLVYGCPDSHSYTVTIVGDNGEKASSSVTVNNNGDH
ncbi:hypothetical protein GCM10009563_20250 [Subtercola frigoramans]